MTYTVPTPSTVSAGDTFPASTYNAIIADLQDHESRIKTGVESYTTAQKNALSGVATGTVVYDSTLGVFQSYTGSAWANLQGTPPALTTAQKTALGTPVTGTMVYDSTLGLLQVWNGTVWLAASGLVHLRSVQLSSSYFTVDNIFTSAFDSYLIRMTPIVANGSGFCYFNERVSGSTSGATWNVQSVLSYTTTNTSSTSATASGMQVAQYGVALGTYGNSQFAEINIVNPYNASVPTVAMVRYGGRDSTTQAFLWNGWGASNTAQQATGFAISGVIGPLAGSTLDVYGWAKAY